MKALIGITNHNIDFVSRALESYSKRNDIPVRVLDFNAKIKKPTKKKYILLVPTVGGVKQNYQILNECPNIIVFVFDAAIQCAELKPIILLDVLKNTPSYLFRYRPLSRETIISAVRKAFNSDDDIRVSQKTINASSRLLKLTYESVVSKFLTFMYRIPNTDRRMELQDMLFDMLWDQKLDDAVEFVQKRYSNKAALDFIEFLRTDKARNFVAALAEIRSIVSKSTAKGKVRPVNYAKVGSKYGVSKFDLKYFMKNRQQRTRRKKAAEVS